jgi:hypothetical protein
MTSGSDAPENENSIAFLKVFFFFFFFYSYDIVFSI